MTQAESKLTRIGVFYDGNFFFHVSNYYHYYHERRARISVAGLHEFIRHQVADSESSDVKYSQIVDAHYFRGRPRAQDADQRGLLLKERLFDDVLVREGVVTHYLPLGPEGEKGIDVWLALEAYELAIYKRFDVSVLIACDGDFLPLVRKLNTIGTRVMLIGWDFKYTDSNNQERETRTAQVLLDEVTYPVMMHQVIDDRSRRNDSLVNNLFVSYKEFREVTNFAALGSSKTKITSEQVLEGTIKDIRAGFGFIKPSSGNQNLFFYYGDVVNADFNDLKVGDRVRYTLGTNQKGICAVNVEVIDS
ncbi:NYN domain-containing protein [Pannus brasiliensis CCIBt3594]|uniref:NYN domain-containing protein n=1 Tax=Pannus brasiliensis CCIBt3594 TaxID=1427578 RepID=A0AAW9QQE0_9CHRO